MAFFRRYRAAFHDMRMQPEGILVSAERSSRG